MDVKLELPWSLPLPLKLNQKGATALEPEDSVRPPPTPDGVELGDEYADGLGVLHHLRLAHLLERILHQMHGPPLPLR